MLLSEISADTDVFGVKHFHMVCAFPFSNEILWRDILLRDLKTGNISLKCWISLDYQMGKVSWLYVSFCILLTPPSGSRVPVQVHCPVPYPVLESHLRDGGGAVQSEHPRALPVDPLRSESGQSQLREPGVHAGQIVHTTNIFTVCRSDEAQYVLLFYLLNVFIFFILSVCVHDSLLNFCLLTCFFNVSCLSPHFFILSVLLTDASTLGLLLDSLEVWSAACLSVLMLWGCHPSQ